MRVLVKTPMSGDGMNKSHAIFNQWTLTLADWYQHGLIGQSIKHKCDVIGSLFALLMTNSKHKQHCTYCTRLYTRNFYESLPDFEDAPYIENVCGQFRCETINRNGFFLLSMKIINDTE
jgi:hypothetical protein